MTLLKTANLTPDKLAHQAAATFPGMAFFANTGPLGETCKSCQNWAGTGRLNNPCAQTRRMTGAEGPKIPGHAWACKYWASKKAKA